MANTLTGLIQYIYDTADVVSRELCGMIPAVYKNSKAEEAAKDQNITYDIVPDASAYDVAPAATPPALDSTTVGTGTMAIDKVRAVKFHWTGEDELAIGRSAKEGIQNNKFAQAFRTLANEMEGDLTGLYKYSSRAYGTAGTTPFDTAGDFTEAAEVLRILKDNGAPLSELNLVINSAAGAKLLGKQSQVHMVGSGDPLRQGVLLDVHGMKIRESAQIKTHTKGTAASSTIGTAGYAVGATSLALSAAGTGTFVTGDVISHARDTANKYVVTTGDTDVSDGGTIVLAKPGIRTAITTATSAITLAANYAANMAFARSAIHLLTRLPKMPEYGDQADDVIVVQDPVSGIFFQIAMYRVYRAVLIEVAVAWGVKAAKPEHMALLLG